MLGRPGEAVRVSVLVPRLDAHPYLASIGWHSGLETLDRGIEAFASYTDFDDPYAAVQIDLDVGGVIGPLIGLTLRPRHLSGWPGLLDALVGAGLCAPQKRDALLAWPGQTVAELEADGQLQSCILERDISHAKISCGAGVEPKAKAYFGVTPQVISTCDG
jgi:hypothetical protein